MADPPPADDLRRKLVSPDAGRVEKRSRIGTWYQVELLARMDLRWIRTKGGADFPRNTKAWVGKGGHIELVRGRTDVIYTEGDCTWIVQLVGEKKVFRAGSAECSSQWVAALRWRVRPWIELLRGRGPERQDRLGALQERDQASWPLRMAHLEVAQSAVRVMDTAAKVTGDVLGKLPVVGPAFSVLGFALEVAGRVKADVDGLRPAQSGLARVARRTMETLQGGLEQQLECRLEELSELMGVIEEGARQLESFEFQSNMRMMVHGIFKGKPGPATVTELVSHCESRLESYEVHDTNEVAHNTDKKMDDIPKQVAAAVESAMRKEDSTSGASSYIPVDPKAIGRDEQASVIKKLILSDNTKYVALVGMGGVGKTTLAVCVMNDPDVQNRFKKNKETKCLGVAFVVVSQNPDLLDCQKRIWEALLGGKADFVTVEDGKRRLEAALQDKSFCLVLDDTWEESDVVHLDVASPNSRVLITSRNDKVAHIVGAKCHDVTPLDEAKSRQLFCKHAFDGGMPKKWQEKHVRDIVEKCAGLPLTLEIMGKLARSFEERAQWQNAVQILTASSMVKKSVFDHVFELSFNSVDAVHREVLLDLAMLPEDHRARATDVAELETCLESCTDEQAACQVLRDLEDRALIKKEGKDTYGMPELQPSHTWYDELFGLRYYLHDVVREGALRFIAIPSMLQRERLVSSQLRDTIGRGTALMAKRFSASQKIRTDQQRVLRELDMPKLQALVLRDAGVPGLPPSILTACLLAIDLTSSGITELPPQVSCLKSLQLLRVDDCSGLTYLPSELGAMVELRVLSMRGCRGIYELPESMGSLTKLSKLLMPECGIAQFYLPDMKEWQRLTMLDLSGCVGLKQLPPNFGDLTCLAHLNLGSCWQLTCLPSSIGQLLHLRVLILHNCRSLTALPDSTTNLAELEELDLQCCERLADLSSSLGSCCLKLRILRLQGIDGMAFPQFASSLECLEVLGLPRGCKVPEGCKQHFEEFEVSLEQDGSGVLWRSDVISITPLHWAAQLGMDKMAAFHLKEVDVDFRDWVGATPLFWAAWNGHTSTAALLLEHGAAVDSTNKDSETPLFSAAWNGHTSTAALLLEHGAAVDAIDKYGATPLFWAAEYGNTSTAALLLEHGAAVDATGEGGATPLFRAARNGHTSTAALLLEHGAAVDATDKGGETPLFEAAEHGHTSTAALLLEHGAAVDATNRRGATPLFWASMNVHTSTAALLLEHGAAVDATIKRGETPLFRAARYGHTSMAALLLEHSATVDATNEEGKTPLLAALLYRDFWSGDPRDEGTILEIVQLLADEGASLDAADQGGKTPLMEAAAIGFTRAAELLLNKGASSELADKEGRTAASLARSKGHDELAEMLEAA